MAGAQAAYIGTRPRPVLAAPGAPDAGVVTIESSPAGLEVSVDGATRGRTPTTLNLIPGGHLLQLTHSSVTRTRQVHVRPGAHTVLSNKYYVDELYNATVVRGTMGGSRGLWGFDARVVDGAVNGSGWATRFSAWCSHMIDKYVVDGAVNLVGWTAYESSFGFRRMQTGLIQNYALLMLFGVFCFVSWYVFAR